MRIAACAAIVVAAALAAAPRAEQTGVPALAFDVFGDFRQSYVLRYRPQGVRAPGWHAIEVKIARRGHFTVGARRGYFGVTARGAGPRAD